MPLDPDLARLLPVLETQEQVIRRRPIEQARAPHDGSVARLTPPAQRATVAHVQDIAVLSQADGAPPAAVEPEHHGDGLLPLRPTDPDRHRPGAPWPAATDDGLAALR